MTKKKKKEFFLKKYLFTFSVAVTTPKKGAYEEERFILT